MIKMARVYDAGSECAFESREILFDTNVWISIYGNDPSRERAVYSNFYASALSKGNTIVTCANVISELFNRMCKIEYELLFGGGEYHLLKSRRKSDEDYLERVESVRDTCLSILEDCELIVDTNDVEAIELQLNEAAKGLLDFTDAALVASCLSNDLIFVSHDRDFVHVDFDLVSANPRVLRGA
ncbi:type II toxin-antitoxin system VapC family toxin [Pseudooceanicola marinus]|uniref:type II toxin-antitoxin system VapC family toxin n=1 Tax=Pseudooceanicola marinus TaxID=396013 RepID=UPI001CD326BF|nr:PIN domain-containing protein [Pseudooceanicola marinus]MCA1334218.1 PIN domain-containing protein [Pseudooceanicola marinus]